MKFSELSPHHKLAALKFFKTRILEAINEGVLIDVSLRPHVEAAQRAADRMQTPWFAMSYLCEDTTAMALIERHAAGDAEDHTFELDHQGDKGDILVIRGVVAVVRV